MLCFRFYRGTFDRCFDYNCSLHIAFAVFQITIQDLRLSFSRPYLSTVFETEITLIASFDSYLLRNLPANNTFAISNNTKATPTFIFMTPQIELWLLQIIIKTFSVSICRPYSLPTTNAFAAKIC